MNFSIYTGGITISGYIWTLSAVTFACFLALAFMILQDTDENTWLARAYQRLRLNRTRMSHLLKRRHVDVGLYLRETPIAEVKAQIARCHDCARQALCDRALRSLAASTSRYSFCPNSRFVDPFANTG